MINIFKKNTKLFKNFFALQPKLNYQFCQTNDITNETFHFFYGQGGTLNIKSKQPKKNVILETIWEDHTEVTIPTNEQFEDVYGWEDDECDNCYVEVENKESLELKEPQQLVAQIPEYYNYKVETNGK